MIQSTETISCAPLAYKKSVELDILWTSWNSYDLIDLSMTISTWDNGGSHCAHRFWIKIGH